MNSDEVFIEVNKQLESIVNRLTNIEQKIDAQNERDHAHELRLQDLENKLKHVADDVNDVKVSLQSVREKINEDVQRDLNNLGGKIRDLEAKPVQAKARIVDRIGNRAFEIIIASCIAAALAWIVTHIK
jgi:chromosome segregation ATPase